MQGSLAVALAWAMIASAAAAASPDRAELATPAPPLVDGSVGLHAPAALLEWGWTGTPPAGTLLGFAAERVTVTVFEVSVQVVATPAGDVAVAPKSERTTYVASDAEVVVEAGREEARLLAFVGGSARVDLGLREAFPLEVDGPVTRTYRSRGDGSFGFSAVSAGDALLVRPATTPGSFALEGNASLYLAGGTLRVESAEGRASFKLEASTETAAAGRMDRYSYAVLAVDGLAASGALPDGATLRLERALVEVEGAARFRDARGTVTTEDGEVEVSREDVTLVGDLALSYASHDDGPLAGLLAWNVVRDWRARGEFASVLLGPVAFVSAEPQVAAAATLLLLAAAGFALYTRIARSRAADHDSRRRLLALVAERPGMHLRALARGLGLGWGTTRYHLGVLARAGLVRIERSGREAHVWPTGRSPDALSRMASRPGEAARVYAGLPEEGGVTLAELRRRLGLSPQLVHHHLRRLVREGLARKVDGPSKRFGRARG